MMLFGYEISTLTLIQCSLVCLLILFILIREYFWYVSYKQQYQSINQLIEEKDNLLLRIQIEESVKYECSNNITLYNETLNLQFNQTKIDSNNHSINTNNHNIYLRDQIYFDMIGVMQIVLCCILIFIEFYLIHIPHLDLASTDSSTEISIKRRLYDFLLKKYPITNIFIHTSVALLSSIAWYGWMNRDEFVHISLKMYISLLIAGPICFVIHNFIRIKNYFPQDLDTWKKSLTDFRWYIWLFSRLIGAYDVLTTTNTILWLLSIMMILLPIRYIFYYRHQSCSIIESNHIFFVNAIGHSSILFICCYTLYILSIMKESCKTTVSSKDTSICQGMGLDTDKYSYFGKMLQYLDNANSIALFSLFAILNTLLLLIRITWFSWISTTGCTWYAWSMIWLFLYIHIGIIIYTLPSVNVLMQKYQTIESYKEGFILQFHKLQNKDNNNNNDNTNKDIVNDSNDDNKNKDDSNVLPQQIFNKILTDSILYYLFVSTSVTNSSSTSKPNNNNSNEGKENPTATTNEDTDSSSKLTTIFLAMLQTTAYSFQNDPTSSTTYNHENKEEDSTK